MSSQPVSDAATEVALRRLREYVAAAIALIIILGAVVMLILAYNGVSSPDTFARIKDLLLFINPLLGVVIGYYFNRVSTEARAESAESTARTATVTAQQAEAARNQAQEAAKATTLEAQETKAALSQMVQATDKLLGAAPGAGATTLGIDEGDGKSAAADATMNWRLALARAKELTQKQ